MRHNRRRRQRATLITGAALVAALAVPAGGIAHDDPRHPGPGPAASNDPSATPEYGATAETQGQVEPSTPAAASPSPVPVKPPAAAKRTGKPASTITEQSARKRQPARAQRQRRSEAPTARALVLAPPTDMPSRRLVEPRAGRPKADAPSDPPANRSGDRRGDSASARGGRDTANRAPAFLEPVAPIALTTPATAAASGGDRPWPLVGFGGLCALLIGAGGALVLARRRPSAGEAQRPDYDDEVEAALQELIAEERAREWGRTDSSLID